MLTVFACSFFSCNFVTAVFFSFSLSFWCLQKLVRTFCSTFFFSLEFHQYSLITMKDRLFAINHSSAFSFLMHSLRSFVVCVCVCLDKIASFSLLSAKRLFFGPIYYLLLSILNLTACSLPSSSQVEWWMVEWKRSSISTSIKKETFCMGNDLDLVISRILQRSFLALEYVRMGQGFCAPKMF